MWSLLIASMYSIWRGIQSPKLEIQHRTYNNWRKLHSFFSLLCHLQNNSPQTAQAGNNRKWHQESCHVL